MLWVEISKNSGTPIIRQVYEQIRSKILNGELKAGEKLPSTRDMAAFFGVSRNVILESYQILLAEGYIVSKPNTGTFVAEGAALEGKASDTRKPPDSSVRHDQGLKREVVDFRSGVPALDLLPRKKWLNVKSQLYYDASEQTFGYGKEEGYFELRSSICRYLQRTRGVYCHPDQILITTGSVQSFSILSRLLLKNNSPYIIEDPLHIKIREIFSMVSKAYYPVPVDEYGLQTSLLPEKLEPALIFVTPSHQYPLGGNLPIQRRIELIKYARKKECYIIEDDYDSEFRYEGLPVSSLQGLEQDLVIYAGTFSKVLFPSIRLGYIVLPWKLVEDCRRFKEKSDYFTNNLEQLTMARFIEERLLERHIAKMKKVYKSRRNTLIESLHKEFPASVNVKGEATGLHLIVEFTNIEFNMELVDFLSKEGVAVYPVWVHSVDKGYPKNLIIMGYSHLDKNSIVKGIGQLKKGLDKWQVKNL